MVKGLKSTCQCRGHGSDPWVQEDSTCQRARNAASHNYWTLHAREPVLCNERGHCDEKPAQQLESSPHSPQLQKAYTQQQRPTTAKNKQRNKHKERSQPSSFRFSFTGLPWRSSGWGSVLQMPGGPGSSLDQGTRSHVLQLKHLHTTMKTRCGQKNTKIQSQNTRKRRTNHMQSKKKKGNIKITAEINDTEKRKSIESKSQNWFLKMLTKLQILS